MYRPFLKVVSEASWSHCGQASGEFRHFQRSVGLTIQFAIRASRAGLGIFVVKQAEESP